MLLGTRSLMGGGGGGCFFNRAKEKYSGFRERSVEGDIVLFYVITRTQKKIRGIKSGNNSQGMAGSLSLSLSLVNCDKK